MNNIKKINLYLPIEGKAREFAPKVFLAITAAKKNFRVFLGSQASINRMIYNKKSSGGVYFFKGGLDIKNVKKIKKKCPNFVILDEEVGPGDENPQFTMRYRIEKNIENEIDSYYVLGKETFEIGKKIFNKIKSRIILSGWPRIDYFLASAKLDKESKLKKSIKKKYGNFILFISDYGQTSMRMVKLTHMQYSQKLDLSKKYNKKKLYEIDSSNKRALKEFEKFILILKNLDKENSIPTIIVRPHPLEDHEPWEKLKKSFSNIKIIFEGELEPWLYASKGVIHKGCSSAIQAYYANKPQAYLSLDKKNIRNALPYKISRHISSIKEIKKFSLDCLNNKNEIKKNNFSKEFNKVIHLSSKSASEIIVNDIKKLKPIKEFNFKPTFNIILKSWINNLIHNCNVYRFYILRYILQFLGKHYVSSDIRLVSQHQKIPFGIFKSDVLRVLDTLGFAKNDIIVKSVLNDLISIEKK